MQLRARSIAFALTNLSVAAATLGACSSSTSSSETDETCKPERGCFTQGCPEAFEVGVAAAQACAVAIDGRFDAAVCEKACNRDGISRCTVEDAFLQELNANGRALAGDASADGGEEAGADGGKALSAAACPNRSAKVTCTPACYGGRATNGVELLALDDGSEGAHFARMAELEAISVIAFERMARELTILGAPRALVESARSAADEERSHAVTIASLAAARGTAARAPELPELEARSLVALAAENAREGCVRESYGAVLAAFAKSRAEDPAVREAMDAIAVEEMRHAELSWELHEWAMSRLAEAEQRAVQREMDLARAELRDSLGEPPAWGARIGLPSLREARTLFEATEAMLFAA